MLLWVAVAAALFESIGAAGYDRFNSGHRIPWLTSVHSTATAPGVLGMLMIPIAVAVLASALVERLRASKTATS